jgi:uncharacterized protein
METRFEWDDQKAQTNLAKHGVSFLEARTVFFDALFATTVDPEHSESEDRFVAVGRSERGWLLVVVYTEWQSPEAVVIRIISSWRATRAERTAYEQA